MVRNIKNGYAIKDNNLDIKRVVQKILSSTEILSGSLNKFPDFFCMGTFIDSTHMKV